MVLQTLTSCYHTVICVRIMHFHTALDGPTDCSNLSVWPTFFSNPCIYILSHVTLMSYPLSGGSMLPHILTSSSPMWLTVANGMLSGSKTVYITGLSPLQHWHLKNLSRYRLSSASTRDWAHAEHPKKSLELSLHRKSAQTHFLKHTHPAVSSWPLLNHRILSNGLV